MGAIDGDAICSGVICSGDMGAIFSCDMGAICSGHGCHQRVRHLQSLCHDMIRDWKLHHDTARAALTGKARLNYGSITLKHARELANQWDMWAATRSNRKRSV
jgi:hypothetical protein